MKKNSLKLCLLSLILIIYSEQLLAQNLGIDVDSLKVGDNENGKTDFSKSFTVTFKNNKVDPTIEIQVVNDEGVFVMIKKGIQNNERDSFQIDFKSSENGRNLLVKKSGGDNLLISPANNFQIKYGKNKVINISNQLQIETDDNKKPQLLSGIDVTGIELHDAILAKKYFDRGSDSLLLLLSKLKKPKPVQLVLDSLKIAYKDNPFIKDLLGSFQIREDKITSQGSGAPKGFSGIASKIGNLDVTTIADGISRFLVKRVKQELSIAFFQHFKDLINKDEYKDAQILFPQTMVTLNAIDQEIYQFENYISTLKESFEEDLSLLLDHMPAVIEEGRFKDYFSEKPNVKYSILVALFSGKELLDGTHPGKILNLIPDEYIDGYLDENVKGSIRTAQLLSESIRSRGEERYWTTTDSLKLLLLKEDKELIAAKFYFGFLYERASDISFKGGKLLDYLKSIHENKESLNKGINEFITYLKQLGQYCSTIENSLDKIKSKRPEEPTIDVYHRLFNSFADVVEHLNKVGELKVINNPIEAAVKKYLTVSRFVSDLAMNIGHKNYGSAIMNVYNIYLSLTDKVYYAKKDTLSNNRDLFYSSISGKDVEEVKKHNLSANKNLVAIINFIKKYGNFMANVVKAKTSEEVAAAIESVALPVGSASIKRHSNWNISLNAYPGLFLGSEKIKNVDENFKPNTAGVSAPIGFAISKGINWQKKCGWSTSLFVSIIDLGAPVSFRFKDDKTEKIPNFKLKDIISPGVFLSVGFPKFPVSCNIGWQSGPLLRGVDSSVVNIAGSTYSRFSVSFAVDIPIFNFFTSSRSKLKL
jgi:hypothetical protein